MNATVTILRHELGHWLTADALGFEVGEISIHRSITGHLSASAKCFPHINLYGKSRKILKHCENRIAILLGGVVAETIFEEEQSADRSMELFETTGKDDYAKVVELIYLKASIRNVSKDRFQEYQTMKISKCWDMASNILNERKDVIGRVSQDMEKRFRGEHTKSFSCNYIRRLIQNNYA